MLYPSYFTPKHALRESRAHQAESQLGHSLCFVAGGIGASCKAADGPERVRLE